MVQVTSKPPEMDTKMSDERAKDTAGVGTTPKPEVQTVRIEWPGLQVGPGSDVIFYKPNQRRSTDQPQGVQPTIWLPNPHGAQWPYNGLPEDIMANHRPAPTSPLEHNLKNISVCAAFILLMLAFLRLLEHLRPMKIFRSGRSSRAENTMKMICQLHDEQAQLRIPALQDGAYFGEKPPNYCDIQDGIDKKQKPSDNVAVPYSCIFTSGKGKVPKVFFYDPRKEQELMDSMGYSVIKGESQHLKINIPTQIDRNDPMKENANVFIEINDPDSESGCIIGMDVLVNRKEKDDLLNEKRGNIPMSIKLDKLDVGEPRIPNNINKEVTL